MSSVPAWLEKYEPQQSSTQPHRIPKTELLATLKSDPESVTVVDIRNEQEKGYINKAILIPATIIGGPEDIAQKFVEPVLQHNPAAQKIVIYCNSSAKRTSYIGGWAKDYLKSNGPKNIDLEILHEGVVGWLAGDESFDSERTVVAA